MNARRSPVVTAGGMTRVHAVVTAMAEDAAGTAEATAAASLGDLIAKAAKEMEHHAAATRTLRLRGLAQRQRATASLAAASDGTGSVPARKLDVVR